MLSFWIADPAVLAFITRDERLAAMPAPVPQPQGQETREHVVPGEAVAVPPRGEDEAAGKPGSDGKEERQLPG